MAAGTPRKNTSAALVALIAGIFSIVLVGIKTYQDSFLTANLATTRTNATSDATHQALPSLTKPSKSSNNPQAFVLPLRTSSGVSLCVLSIERSWIEKNKTNQRTQMQSRKTLLSNKQIHFEGLDFHYLQGLVGPLYNCVFGAQNVKKIGAAPPTLQSL